MNAFGRNKVSILLTVISLAIFSLGLWVFFGDNFLGFLKGVFWVIFAVSFFAFYLLMMVPASFLMVLTDSLLTARGYYLSKFSKFSVGLAGSTLSALFVYYVYFPVFYFLVTFFGGNLSLEGKTEPAFVFTPILFVFSIILVIGSFDAKSIK